MGISCDSAYVVSKLWMQVQATNSWQDRCRPARHTQLHTQVIVCTCLARSIVDCLVSVCPRKHTSVIPCCVMQGWGTLLLAQAGIVLNLLYTAISRPLVLTVLLMLVCGALLMVTGMWLTLQFRFIQMQYPAVVLAFERQVLTASIPVAAIMQVSSRKGRKPRGKGGGFNRSSASAVSPVLLVAGCPQIGHITLVFGKHACAAAASMVRSVQSVASWQHPGPGVWPSCCHSTKQPRPIL
jgi:hypothetical protein